MVSGLVTREEEGGSDMWASAVSEREERRTARRRPGVALLLGRCGRSWAMGAEKQQDRVAGPVHWKREAGPRG